MARKRTPADPARDRSRDDESLLLRSAESLGRMIGSLQRQLEIATGRIAATRPNGTTGKPAKSRSGGTLKAKNGTTRARTPKARTTPRQASPKARAKKR